MEPALSLRELQTRFFRSIADAPGPSAPDGARQPSAGRSRATMRCVGTGPRRSSPRSCARCRAPIDNRRCSRTKRACMRTGRWLAPWRAAWPHARRAGDRSARSRARPLGDQSSRAAMVPLLPEDAQRPALRRLPHRPAARPARRDRPGSRPPSGARRGGDEPLRARAPRSAAPPLLAQLRARPSRRCFGSSPSRATRTSEAPLTPP